MSRYLNIVRSDLCTGCGACSAICPKGCITMSEDRNGFKIPMVGDACVHCGLCEKVCPVLNSDCGDTVLTPIKILATKNKDISIVAQSSSGGIFSALAEYILGNNGVVYGVALTSTLAAEHLRIEKRDDIGKLQGSKYLHSDAAKAYPDVLEDLTTGKEVLFSGTPCQVAALRHYLRKDFPTLLCVEVVCHGVPTNKAFKEYVKWLEHRYNTKVIAVNFRDKSKGWNDNCVSFEFCNGKTFRQRSIDNLYLQGYVNNLFVRDSCMDCRFKGFKSKADITLGDMWGIESIIPEYDVANGVSMVSINSSVGELAFQKIKDKLTDCIEVSYDDVVMYNGCISKSVTGHRKRLFILEQLSISPIDVLIKQALGINLKTLFIKKFLKVKSRFISSLVVIKHSIFK